MKFLKSQTTQITISGLFAALIFAGTCISFEIPNGQGFVNLGDGLILTATVLIGNLSIPAAAIGAMFADIILGFALYAPATLVVKALVALTACFFIKLSEKKGGVPVVILGFIAAELVMVAGYFLYELAIYGFAGASASVVFNCIQGAVAVAAAILLRPVALRLKERVFPERK